MDTWASLLEKSPFIAIILALGVTCLHLFRSREKAQKEDQVKYEALQEKYTADLIKATEAMNSLATENLKQSFSDSAAWRDNVREFGDTLRSHYATLKRAIEENQGQTTASELEIKKHISDAVDRLKR